MDADPPAHGVKFARRFTPAYVDDGESATYCSSAFQYDEAQRELSSKYIAALIMFTFIWNAYEAAAEKATGGLFTRDKIPVRARRLLQQRAGYAATMVGLAGSHQFAPRVCCHDEDLAAQIAASEREHQLTVVPAAAELARLFRNHLVHGAERPPTSPEAVTTHRLYAMTRLILLLIQALVLCPAQAHESLSLRGIGDDEDDLIPVQHAFLNLHRREELWLSGA